MTTRNKPRGVSKPLAPWRFKIHEVIFEADTPLGKLFDVALIIAILLSLVVVVIESVESVSLAWGGELFVVEWIFTLLFTVEYCLRLVSVKKPHKYAISFFGVIDLLSILPTYLALFALGGQFFLIIRALRLIRLFRIFKMARYVQEAHVLTLALKASRPKIVVFLFFVVMVVTIVGALMHMIEGQVNPSFADIPHGIYWAVVTVTTVGYGDIAPMTMLGKFIATALMILGYGIIAIPGGIVGMELIRGSKGPVNTQSCPSCSEGDHDNDAVYCKYCSEELNPD